MFIYLSKKIAIPNGVKLKSVSWNLEHGWIACGGENGLLKVLKLESQAGKDSRAKGVAAPSNLSMNQTLEGHNGAVMVVTWNPHYRKLTTSDQNGLIIVWMLHKGMWFEEMINNRNKSVVRDMKWKYNGQEICIIYEDGAVIVGSVDGNRLWGKELKTKLAFVEWSPDGRSILFVTIEGEVHLYNQYGNKIGQVPLYAIEDAVGSVQVIGIHWYDGAEGYSDPLAPTLAIAFENGRVQIMRSEADEEPVLIDTGMRLTQCKWNSNGTVLALAGSQVSTMSTGEKREVSQVQFYAPDGVHLRTLKVPGSSISALSWEGGGLRIAFGVDSYVYFANIRPDYKWGAFGNTVVYSFNKPERPEQCVVFWDTYTNESYTKYVKHLLDIKAAGENCVLATGSNDSSAQYILILCNAIGAPVDSKYIDIQPTHLTMTEHHVIAANEDTVYVWQYRTPVSKLTSVDATGGSLRRKEGRERTFHVEDVSFEGEGPAPGRSHGTSDAIVCIGASERYLVVGRASGTVQRYTLPHISLTDKYVLRCRPQKLALNCDSTRMSIIDINGILSFLDLDVKKTDAAGNTVTGDHLAYERKDTWDMMWAEDNPALFAAMEKTRMYIFRDLDPEEPVLSSGYMAEFKDLRIKSVLLDEIMAQPEHPDKSMVIDYESRSLRDARHLLASNRIPDAMQFIEDNSHPRLWRLLAETALEELDFVVAEKAFIRCVDYQGIQFVKRLRKLDDKTKQRAEVAVYFQRFDEAETLYRDIDRKDLAIELRMRLGDWFRVVQLVQSGGGDDELLGLAWNRIGDYYADRQRWTKAVQYYTQAKNAEALVDCFYILEDFAGLEALTHRLSEGSPLLNSIGQKLQSVGLSEAAVVAYLKAGDVKAAVDCCVLLNQWDQAVELAEQHEFPQIEGLLGKYATHLLSTGKTLAAIELYRKANKATESAKLLANMAQEVVDEKARPVRAKRLYVLAALEVERHKARTMDMTTMTAATVAGTTKRDTAAATAATLDTLLKQDAEATSAGEGGAAARTLDNAWHGAEAMHFFLLCQRQLYAGNIDAAMKTALRLANYEDVLDPKDIYSLIALTSFYNEYYAQASRAFIKLESLESITDKQREAYRDLALSIFVSHAPVDPGSRTYPCPNRDCSSTAHDWDTACMKCGTKYPGCTVTGRAILDSSYSRCRTCRHKCFKSELRGLENCPLCHSPFNRAAGGVGGASAPSAGAGAGIGRGGL